MENADLTLLLSQAKEALIAFHSADCQLAVLEDPARQAEAVEIARARRHVQLAALPLLSIIVQLSEELGAPLPCFAGPRAWSTDQTWPCNGARAMDCLFLDFDGVLHSNETWAHKDPPRIRLHAADHDLFEYAPILEELIAPYEISIVLSTSWVRSFGLECAIEHLPPGLQRRVCGSTYDAAHSHAWRFDRLTRYDQILIDVGRRNPARWLAIDDDPLGWPAADLEHLVLTPGATGLGSPRAQAELCARLASVFK